MYDMKEKKENISFTPKKIKRNSPKKIIPILTRFAVELPFFSYSSSFYCRVYCLQKRYFTLCYSDFLLAALVLAYLVLSSLLCF